MDRSEWMVLVGGLMLAAGAIIPFLMVIRTLPPSLLLSVLSYACSLGGLFVGMIGLAGVRGRLVEADRRARDGTGEMFDFE